MPVRCPRCSRANPPGAAYCYLDGSVLSPGTGAHVNPARVRFPMPFVFPSGKTCQTFDELVLAFTADWKAARDVLRDGAVAGFLSGLGRADLAQAAKQAQTAADPDGALDDLIRRLPSTVYQRAKLAVTPAAVNLGQLKPGKDVLLELSLQNLGMGVLAGSVASSTDWLFLGPPSAPDRKKLFQFLSDATVPFHIPAKRLRAANKPFEGELVVETAGGREAVPVRFSVPVTPYPDGVLAGSRTPREVAEKAKEKPTEAAALFASGAVQRWYETNGWDYPVQEAAASGVAAVQQFFEALGLTKPPKVNVNRTEVTLSGRPGERATGSVVLTTEEKRPVWAAVTSDADWLDVRTIEYEGRTATVHLGAARVPAASAQARVTITTNGRVKHVVTVRLNVSGAPPAPAYAPTQQTVAPTFPPAPAYAPTQQNVLPVLPPAPAYEAKPAPPTPAPEVQEGGAARLLLAGVPLAVLLLGLCVPLARDVAAFFGGKAGPIFVGGDDDPSKYPDGLTLALQDKDMDMVVAAGASMKPEEGAAGGGTPVTCPASMRFGLSLKDGDRRLTFGKDGMTNNCVVQVNGTSFIFGEGGWQTKDGGPGSLVLPGKWVTRDEPVAEKGMRAGRRSVWLCGPNGVKVTQTVGLLPGAQSRAFDTCRVHYKVENGGGRPQQVGLRFMLDTFIGTNDGVPFLIPGQTQLCSTTMQFNRTDDIPDFIQACEREDPADPGTVAQIGLRLTERGLDPPTRVTLGAYPNPNLSKRFFLFGRQFKQEMTEWEVPVVPIKTLNPGDSAVVIYWGARPLAPGASREMAFTYGLGAVSGEKGSNLALTAGGSFVPNGEFTLTAYVRDPQPGARLRLTLPEGFKLVSGEAEASVSPPPGDGSTRISPVTWRVRGGPSEGKYDLKVKMGSAEQTQQVRLRAGGLFGG